MPTRRTPMEIVEVLGALFFVGSFLFFPLLFSQFLRVGLHNFYRVDVSEILRLFEVIVATLEAWGEFS